MRKNIISKNVSVFIFVLFGLMLAGLMFIMPMFGDDLLHGKVGVGLHFMSSVNGRYLGNLFGINLSSSLFLRVVVKTIVLLGTIYFVYKICASKKLSSIFIVFLLCLWLPKELFREVIVFSSGFGNYVVPTLGILAIIYFHFNKKYNNSKWLYPVLFLGGIINSLFVEHVTLYNMILSVFLFIFSIFKEKDRKYYYLVYMVGSFIGTVLMFTNPIYLISFRGEDNYRAMTAIGDMVNKLCIIVNDAFWVNTFIVITLLILTMFLLEKSMSSKPKIVIVLKSYVAAYFVYYLFKLFNPSWAVIGVNTIYLNTILTLGLFGVLILSVIFAKIDKRDKYQLIFLLVSYVLILGPLLAVNPIGPRCYYTGYIVIVLFILKLMNILEEKKCLNMNGLGEISVVGLVVLFAFNYSIYYPVYKENINRLENIRQQIDDGNTEIYVSALPNLEYLHGADMCHEYIETVYKIQYDIDPDTVFIKEGCLPIDY